MGSEDYYRRKVLQIYRTYPAYTRDKEPPGYMHWLKQKEPQIIFDASFSRVSARGLGVQFG
jgi:hypothetical protein